MSSTEFVLPSSKASPPFVLKVPTRSASGQNDYAGRPTDPRNPSNPVLRTYYLVLCTYPCFGLPTRHLPPLEPSIMSSVETTTAGQPSPSRRDFLKHSSAIAAGSSIVASFADPAVHAQGSETVNVALIGCGGRGSGAALNAMKADPSNRLTVMCDLFPDRLNQAKQGLSRQLGKQFEVKDDTSFSGIDGYKRVMDSDVKVVLLCTTPHFRPLHLQAAIDAGKHVFCEKPVAVDAPGVRKVLATSEQAKKLRSRFWPLLAL